MTGAGRAAPLSRAGGSHARGCELLPRFRGEALGARATLHCSGSFEGCARHGLSLRREVVPAAPGLVLAPLAGAPFAAVSLLLLALGATALGFLVLALAGAGRRAPAEAARAGDPGDDAAGLAWVRARGVAGLERLLVALLGELGLTVERADRGESSVDLQATDPTPIRGGRVLVHAVLAAPGAAVTGGDVRAALDTARADAFGKALVVTLGRFSDEAREAAREQPAELVDGAALAALVRRHLPQAWATRTI